MGTTDASYKAQSPESTLSPFVSGVAYDACFVAGSTTTGFRSRSAV